MNLQPDEMSTRQTRGRNNSLPRDSGLGSAGNRM